MGFQYNCCDMKNDVLLLQLKSKARGLLSKTCFYAGSEYMDGIKGHLRQIFALKCECLITLSKHLIKCLRQDGICPHTLFFIWIPQKLNVSCKLEVLSLLCFSLFCLKDTVCQIHRVHLWSPSPELGRLSHTISLFVHPLSVTAYPAQAGSREAGADPTWHWASNSVKMLRSWFMQINFTNCQILFVYFCYVRFNFVMV